MNGKALVDDGRVSGATSTQLAISSLAFADGGDYSLVASNGDGSVADVLARLAVTPVVSWGDDSCGQLRIPVQASNVVAVSAGEAHSLALLSDGTAIGWGDNQFGQTTPPLAATNLVAVAAGGAHSLGVSAQGEVFAWGDSSYRQTSVPQRATGVVAVAAGARHSLALLGGGTVVAWGDNTFGQTNVPASAQTVVAVAAGDTISLALRADGTLVSWGSVIGTNQISLIAAGSEHWLVRRNGGEVLAWGRNYYGQTVVPAAAAGAVAIAAGGDHSLSVGGDGQVVAWGGDCSGQIDVPPAASNILGLAAGGAHNLALGQEARQFLGAQPATGVVTLGGEAFFLSGVTSLPGATYQWQLNEQNIPGATNAFLLLPFVHWTNAGNYRVLGSNALGTFATPSKSLAIQRRPLRFDISAGAAQLTPDGLRLRLLGAAGLSPVVVHATTNFAFWEPVYTNPPVIGDFEFLDAESTNRPRTFYRASEQGVP